MDFNISPAQSQYERDLVSSAHAQGARDAEESQRHDRKRRKDGARLAARLAGKEFRDALAKHLNAINTKEELLDIVNRVQLEFCQTN